MSSRQKGLTLVEVLVAIGILGMLIFASLSLTTSALNMTRLNLDRQLATEKAISILEELKSVAQNNASSNGGVVVLDQFDDGNNTRDELTIQSGALPADPISGNVIGPHGWLYQRRISVIRIGGQSSTGVRLVRVAVFRDDKSGLHLLAEVSSVIRTFATTMPQTQVYDVYAIAVENVPGWWVYTSSLVPFVQNAISELQDRNPGLEFRVHWIKKLSFGRNEEYRPFINQANPSTNNIDSVYFYPGALPQSDSTQNPPDLDSYYPTAEFQAHMNVDGADTNNYTTSTPSLTQPYALADQYNHATRYYDEKAIFNARVAAGLEDATTPTYRLLLDDMILNPTAYTNAILINLHGELFPFPPTRNYSDPAKAPDTLATSPNNLQNIRVVTHPEFLTYNAGTNINLRVYAYEAPTGSSSIASGVLPVPVTVVVRGLDLTSVASTVSVTRIEGGLAPTLVPSGDTTPSGGNGYVKSSALVAPSSTRMSATVTAVTVGGVPNTLIKLVNTPFRHPVCTGTNCASIEHTSVSNNAGLASSAYLYNQQYIPAPLENFAQATAQTPFGIDLATNATGEKNTARWIVTINGANLTTILNARGVPAIGGIPACAAPCANTALTIETRIGDAAAGTLPTTGTMWPVRNQPPNLSRTYLWRGTNLWLYGDGTNTNLPNLPQTERFQFMGDPRHCPYADLKMPHTNNSGAWNAANVNTNIGMGYNRYFDDFENTTTNAISSWPGWQYTAGGTTYGVKNDGNTTNSGYQWGTTNGQLEIDIQRAFQTVRKALTSSQAIYTTMTGYSYYYVGIGGEIGYDDANQFPNSIPLSSKPFTGAGGNSTEQSIINGCTTCGVKYVRQGGSGTNYWWAMNWLGELYPDNFYLPANGWAATGNLPTGPGATDFRRVMRGSIGPTTGGFILPTGTTFSLTSDDAAVRRTGGPGSTNLFWTGTAGATFHHTPNDNNGSLIAEGLDIANATSGYNFPLLNPVSNNRPFALGQNQTGDNPELFLSSVYGPVFPSSQQAQFYSQTGLTIPGSALLSLRDPVSNNAAFIVVNGLSPVGASGSSYIARWSFLTLIHSYFLAGLYPVAGTETSCASCPSRVRQLPRVNISFPGVNDDLKDPTSINIQWTTSWTRWDGRKYTPAYSNTFSETGTVQYQVMYSDDNGVTWKWCDPSIAGTPSLGRRNPAALITATNYNWSTPAGTFPMANYLIRVEAYRQNFSLHYSYHQFRAFIRR
jgi:prepilin-type N-terminal cleavage/methylation domain-containing protein